MRGLELGTTTEACSNMAGVGRVMLARPSWKVKIRVGA